MRDPNKAAAIEALLGDLCRATIGSTFNQFREVGPDDLPDAPRVRLGNLRHYLEERADAEVLAVGEAAGYQGMRWSGIAFTSEFDLLRWGEPYRRSSRRARPWKEPSGTIVHGTLDELGAERRVILWNTVPTHPHLLDLPMSNREAKESNGESNGWISVLRPASAKWRGSAESGRSGCANVKISLLAQA